MAETYEIQRTRFAIYANPRVVELKLFLSPQNVNHVKLLLSFYTQTDINRKQVMLFSPNASQPCISMLPLLRLYMCYLYCDYIYAISTATVSTDISNRVRVRGTLAPQYQSSWNTVRDS